TYAYAALPTESFDRALGEDLDKTAVFVKKMIEKAKCTTKLSVAALPISSVFSSIISVPGSTEKEIQESIKLQARKLIPVPLEEVSLDSKVIDTEATGEGTKK